MFARLAKFISHYWWLVLAVWLVVPAAVKCVAPRWDDITHDGDFAYLPTRMTSVRGADLMASAFPNLDAKSQLVLIVARHDGPLGDDDMAVVDQLAKEFEPGDEKGPVASVWTPRTDVVGRKLLSPVGKHGQAALVTLQLRNEFMAIGNMQLLARTCKFLNQTEHGPDFPKGLELGVSGSAAFGADMLISAKQSVDRTETTTVILVVLILLVVYRAPGLVLVPLATIIISMTLAIDLIALLAQYSSSSQWLDFKVFGATKILIVVVLYGAATDYCLFLISRYREELGHGLSPKEAVDVALSQVGHAVAASAMTTILGLGTMIFADFGKFRYGGPAIAIALTFALIASLTLTPALLRAAGPIVFWPFTKSVLEGNSRSTRARGWGRTWEWIAGTIMARPGLVFVGGLLLLAAPAWVGIKTCFEPDAITYDLPGELSSVRPSVKGTRLLTQYFPIGETGPITVLAHLPGVNFDHARGRGLVAHLNKELCDLTVTDAHGAKVNPIVSVRCRTNPLGKPPERLGFRDRALIGNRRVKEMFLAQNPAYKGSVTRLDLICKFDPFSAQSVHLLDAIEERLKGLAADKDSPWHGAEFDYVGTTAGIRDLRAINESDYVRIGILTSLAVLAVLVFLLRRIFISLYLILTVLLGYFVTFGITKLLFMWIYGDTFNGLDWKLPIYLFVILVAVGEDYNIYLATRVFEEQRRLGAREGLRLAVVRTGGIITSCGVIMAGTFASMTSGTLRGMHELGFSLAFGVLLDTFVIRTIIVPAFMALMVRWFPKSAAATPAEEPPKNLRLVHGKDVAA